MQPICQEPYGGLASVRFCVRPSLFAVPSDGHCALPKLCGRVFFIGGGFLNSQEKREHAVRLLCAKRDALGRIPKKEDFPEAERSRIKAFLGPWPRALEAAGLKKPKTSIRRRTAAHKRKSRERQEGT